MILRKVLVVLALVLGLVLAGYFWANGGIIKAQENNDDTAAEEIAENEEEAAENEEEAAENEEEEDEEEEVTATEEEEEEEEEVKWADKQFDKLVKRLERTELRAEKVSMSLMITPQGKATLVNASLETIAGTNLSVKIFGLTFDVDASEAKISGGGKNTTLSDLNEGDQLLIKGVVNEGTGVIKAIRIHDRSLHKKAISNLQARIQELLRLIEELRASLAI